MLKLVIYFYLTIAVMAAIDESAGDTSRLTFDLMNEKFLSKGLSVDTVANTGPIVANLKNEHYFITNEGDTWTYAIVAPTDESAHRLARHMISEASRLYDIYGFQYASHLLQCSLWAFFTAEFNENAKVAAFYATRYDNILEIVNTGSLWTGIFHNGVLVNTTKPPLADEVVLFLSDDFFPKIDPDGMYALGNFVQVWDVHVGDILVTTWADPSTEFRDIVQMAVASVEEFKAPVLQIVANLQAYYNLDLDKGRMFAVVKVT